MRAKEFITEEKKNGLYLALKLDHNSASILEHFTKNLGLKPIPAKYLHVTLYKVKKLEIDLSSIVNIPKPNLTVQLLNSFGKFSHPEKNIHGAMYINLGESNQLNRYRRDIKLWFRDTHGIRLPSNSDKWSPHITLSFQNIEEKIIRLNLQNGPEQVKLSNAIKRGYLQAPIKQISLNEIWLDNENSKWSQKFL